MNQPIEAYAGVFVYEFRMQLRRRASWIAVGVAVPFLLLGILLQPLPDRILNYIVHLTPPQLATFVIAQASTFLPIVFGILLADRLPRDRRLRTTELLDSLPVSTGARLWGKYLGATVATAIPLALGYLTFTASIALKLDNPALIPAFFLVFPLVVLPGLLFVGAFSIACTEVLPVPLYAILYTGYWLWGNAVAQGKGIPTINCTPLTPIGHYAAAAFFTHDLNAQCGAARHNVSITAGIGSIVLLLAVGFLAILVVQTYINRRAASR